MNNSDIDIVVLWVDPQDPEWQNEYNTFASNKIDTSNDKSRFRDFGTLRFVFRSIEMFLPWVRKIHLVTHGHYPEWLDKNNSQINVVSHKEMFKDPTNLPVFNSQAIEMNFLGIEDLAENFIYFNDDTIVFNDVGKDRFFKNELPVDFLIQGLPRKGWFYRKFIRNNLYVDAINNDLDSINSHFSKWKTVFQNPTSFFNREYNLKQNIQNFIFCIYPTFLNFKMYHHPQAYLKSTLQEVYNEFSEKINYTSSSKFRSTGDYNQFIYRYWQLVSGLFYPQYSNDHVTYHITNEKDLQNCIADFSSKAFICINDSPKLDGEQYDRAYEQMQRALTSHFPNKSKFEK